MVALINERTGRVIARRLTRCDTFWKRGRGLMLRRALEDDHAYLFIESRESIALAAVHMFFVFFPIAVLWLDDDRQVVDKVLARPFRPFYAPSAPARYIVECSPVVLKQVAVGDRLSWTFP